MVRHIKMALYGEPGVGKSVFANKAPNRLFITTDGNYEFLEDFGAKQEDCVRVKSWKEAKKVIDEIIKDNGTYSKYDSYVVDLTEDLFKWCEYEYCKANGYEHVSDVGFAKGYDITRTDFFIEISKLLSLDKNIFLLMHGITYEVKDRRGIAHTKHGPTNRIPDKVIDQIEGRVRYFLRCYLKAEEIDGKLIKKRYLSLVPKENEFGIIRGINENNIPADIPLDFDTFASVIGFTPASDIKSSEVKEVKSINVDMLKKATPKAETKAEVKAEEPAKEEVKEPVKETVKEPAKEVKEAPKAEEPVKEVVETKTETKVEVVNSQPTSANDKLASILAKLKNRQ